VFEVAAGLADHRGVSARMRLSFDRCDHPRSRRRRRNEISLPTSNDVRPWRKASRAGEREGQSRDRTRSFFAVVSLRAPLDEVGMRLAGVPPAVASAKMSNTSVNPSHSVTASMKPAGASPLQASACSKATSVSRLPYVDARTSPIAPLYRGVSAQSCPISVAFSRSLPTNQDSDPCFDGRDVGHVPCPPEGQSTR